MADSKEYNKHLTPELRLRFKTMGYDVVQHDLVNHRYGTPEKRMAAIAWLAETREEAAQTSAAMQQRAIEAAERSAVASEIAAEASKISARWTMWAAIIALVTTVASVLGTFLTWWLRGA